MSSNAHYVFPRFEDVPVDMTHSMTNSIATKSSKIVERTARERASGSKKGNILPSVYDSEIPKSAGTNTNRF